MKTIRLLGAMLLALLFVPQAYAEQADMKVGISVTSSSSTVVPANSRRVKLTIINSAATNPMTCTTIGTATATNGYIIAAGGSVTFDRKSQAKRKYQCISASGTTASYDEVTDPDGELSAPTPTPLPTPTP